MLLPNGVQIEHVYLRKLNFYLSTCFFEIYCFHFFSIEEAFSLQSFNLTFPHLSLFFSLSYRAKVNRKLKFHNIFYFHLNENFLSLSLKVCKKFEYQLSTLKLMIMRESESPAIHYGYTRINYFQINSGRPQSLTFPITYFSSNFFAWSFFQIHLLQGIVSFSFAWKIII